jgi:poly(hydroxyalkanoate) depolymerase family esterase
MERTGVRWSPKLKALGNGIRLAGRVLGAELLGNRASVPETGQFVTFDEFGPNPGRLRMLVHTPAGNAAAGRPLVLMLHGCGQSPAEFAAASGWLDLADRLTIPLVLPEQALENNRHRCFHWFQPTDTARDRGEAGSIASMTRTAIAHFGSDSGRVFVLGLSAGGAMAASLLAAYPDVFTAGAVVAGLPVGAALSATEAWLRMASAGPELRSSVWADQVRRVAPPGYRGPWPRLSIWHGGNDTMVAPDNALLLAKQWRALHGLAEQPARDLVEAGARHRAWGDAVELWTLPGMAHGYPVGGGTGRPGPFVLDYGIPATAHIARFWGLD